eukprot:5542850-Prymnesium_polylepis.1
MTSDMLMQSLAGTAAYLPQRSTVTSMCESSMFLPGLAVMGGGRMPKAGLLSNTHVKRPGSRSHSRARRDQKRRDQERLDRKLT